MSRNRKVVPHPKHNAMSALGWFGSADESMESVGDWDVKQAAMVGAVLEVLSAGDGIMFGISMDGRAVSVTVYSGDTKHRKWVTDAIEFDDLMAAIYRRGLERRGRLGEAEQAAAAD